MLVRILTDNPGPTFTQGFDESFVKNVLKLLRGCKDQGTQQILREALDSIEVNKSHDEGAQGLIAMWKKEKGAVNRLNTPRMSRGPGGYQGGGFQVQHGERILLGGRDPRQDGVGDGVVSAGHRVSLRAALNGVQLNGVQYAEPLRSAVNRGSEAGCQGLETAWHSAGTRSWRPPWTCCAATASAT